MESRRPRWACSPDAVCVFIRFTGRRPDTVRQYPPVGKLAQRELAKCHVWHSGLRTRRGGVEFEFHSVGVDAGIPPQPQAPTRPGQTKINVGQVAMDHDGLLRLRMVRNRLLSCLILRMVAAIFRQHS